MMTADARAPAPLAADSIRRRRRRRLHDARRIAAIQTRARARARKSLAAQCGGDRRARAPLKLRVLCGDGGARSS